MCVFVWWIGRGLEWEAVATGHSGLIIINHLSGHMFMAWPSVIPFREAKAAGPVRYSDFCLWYTLPTL